MGHRRKKTLNKFETAHKYELACKMKDTKIQVGSGVFSQGFDSSKRTAAEQGVWNHAEIMVIIISRDKLFTAAERLLLCERVEGASRLRTNKHI